MQKATIPTRLQIMNTLMIRFHSDYEAMIKQYEHAERIELTEHLLEQVETLSEYHKTKDQSHQKQYFAREDALLKKYRSRLQPYIDGQIGRFFDFQRVFIYKDILTQEQFNSMKNAAEQSLSGEEIEWFLADCKHLLKSALYFLYLYNDEESTAPNTVESDKEMTKARQLLTIYYFLKASVGIESRDSNSASGIARFIHLLTGTKFTTIQNSDIYKKFLKMPNYKKDKQLIEDLRYIRPYFVDLGLQTAVEAIDAELRLAIKELPLTERKKYANDFK